MNNYEIMDLLDRPIAYHRAFIPLGGVTGAVMLSQAYYWSSRTKDSDGWFYKTADEWKEETGLSIKEQATARKRLRDCGVLEEVKKGVPCKVHYRINKQNLYNRLVESSFADSDKLDLPNEQNSVCRMGKTITENTTENTTYTPISPKGTGTGKRKTKSKNSFSEPTSSGYSERFEKFWEVYGKWGNKKTTWSKWKLLTDEQLDDINKKILPYLQSTSGDRMQYRKKAETYLNPDKEYWNDTVLQPQSFNNNNGYPQTNESPNSKQRTWGSYD